MRVTKKRWNKAQIAEYSDWTQNLDYIRDEYLEAERKYNHVLSKVKVDFKLTKNMTLLDVGCNATLVSRFLKCDKIIGVDPLGAKLEQHVEGLDKNTFKIIEGTGENLKALNKKFDIIFCRNVLDHCQDTDLVLKNANDCLNENGIFILAIYVYHPFIAFLRIVAEITYFFRNEMHPHTFTKKNIYKDICKLFLIEDEYLIYGGKNSFDFGKSENKIKSHVNNLSTLLHYLFNKMFNLLFPKQNFVEEYLFISRKVGQLGLEPRTDGL